MRCGQATPIERRWQQARGGFRGIQRATGIEDEAVALGVRGLDAAPTDLLGAAVDREGYGQGRAFSVI